MKSLLSSLSPALHDGVFVFTSVHPTTDLHGLDVVATMREDEGLSLVLPEAEARSRGFPILFRAAWITLCVASDLQAVGLTAAVANALAAAGIACNVIAGVHHDHVFVPFAQAAAALSTLRELQASGGG